MIGISSSGTDTNQLLRHAQVESRLKFESLAVSMELNGAVCGTVHV